MRLPGAICGSFMIYEASFSYMRLNFDICGLISTYAVEADFMRTNRSPSYAWANRKNKSQKEANKLGRFLLAFLCIRAWGELRGLGYAWLLRYMRLLGTICGAFWIYEACFTYMRLNSDICVPILIYEAELRLMRLKLILCGRAALCSAHGLSVKTKARRKRTNWGASFWLFCVFVLGVSCAGWDMRGF